LKTTGYTSHSELAAQTDHAGDGVVVTSVRVLTWTTPIALWLVHLFVVLPQLNAQPSGEARFIQAIGFFMWSALVMIGCFVISLVVVIVRRSRRDLIPLLLNLSWLYYLKVIVLGPTIGNL